MRRLIFFIFPCLCTFVCLYGQGTPAPTADRLQSMADSALIYCKAKGMNTEYCVMVDMSVHSGRKRLWVWDFSKNEPLLSSLCCHGSGLGSTTTQPVFSNTPGSYCTSLGKYRIGIRSWSQWGINVHYKLHGLESTNDNAYKRIVVLHSHNPVPETEIHPLHLPMGWSLGCPVVSNNVMTALDKTLQQGGKPVLLWIYE